MSRRKCVSYQNSKRPATRKSSKFPIIFTALLIVVIIFVTTITIIKVSEFITSHQNNNFPKLEISLYDAPIEQINANSKNTVYYNNTATFTISNNTSTFDNVELKGRGNFTWERIKKPYQIKLAQKTSLFNLNPAKKWLLLANYLDDTNLRNSLAFYLEKILKEPFALSGDFIELYFDTQYYGLYYLTEKVEIGKTRINLKNNGGILVELDNIYGGEKGCYYDISGNCLTIADTTNRDTAEISIQSFLNNFNQFQVAIREQNYNDIENLIDINSFVRYYLLNEFAVNPDAYNTSLFFYVDDENDKIHAGPGWDFDIAFGYPEWIPAGVDPEAFHSPFETSPLKTFVVENPNTETTTTTFFFDLMALPELEQKVKETYKETLSGHGEELFNYIKDQANYIREAALRDQARWKIKSDFDEEVDYLLDWVEKRYKHFEEIYGVSSNPALESPQLSSE